MKRKLTLSILAVILTASFAAPSVLHVSAQTQDELAEEAAQGIGSKLQENLDKDSFAFAQTRRRLRTTPPSYPEAYDLRDENLVTKVKLQNPYGTCWGFAGIAAAESSILKSNLYSGTPEIDLSEKHLAYFARRTIRDNSSNPHSQNGEGIIVTQEPEKSSSYYEGGLSVYATQLFSSGRGPVLESRGEVYQYHGRNRVVDESDLWYSEDDDWSINDDLAFVQDYALKQSAMLPNPAEYLIAGDTSNFARAIEAMKSEVYAGRPLQLSFFASVARPGEEDLADYINLSTWAHYTFNRENANHAVTVVGWDDNYPKENFVHTYVDQESHERVESPAPANNGAWLVKNSWGSGESEFPNRGSGSWGLLQGQDRGPDYEPSSGALHTGYFWLSYEDLSIDTIETLTFENSDPNTVIAQYDLMPVNTILPYESTSVIKMGNVFRAGDFTDADSLRITDVGIFTVTPQTSAHYDLYVLDENYTDPEGEVPIAQGDVTYPYGGFHKTPLSETILVGENEYFSLVVTLDPGSQGKYQYLGPVGLTEDWYTHHPNPENPMREYQLAVVNERESYVLDAAETGREWMDLYTFRDDLISENPSDYTWDNYPFKVYLEPTDEPEPGIEVTAPEAITGLTYDGQEHALITAGSVTDTTAGEPAQMVYGCADEDGQITYDTAIPEGLSAGNYTVYYQVRKGETVRASGAVVTTIAKRAITVTREDAGTPWKYDGSEHGPELSTDVLDGDACELEVDCATRVDAGNYTAEITGITGEDAGNYLPPGENLTYDYSITKREVTLTSGDASSEYTGRPVTCSDVTVSGDGFADGEGATYDVTGSRLAPGTSENTFTYRLNPNTASGNYEITTHYGSLVVTWWDPADNPEHVVEVEAASDTVDYDGREHTVSGLADGCDTFEFAGETYTIEGLSAQVSGTNAGSYTNTITGTAVIKDPRDTDVTEHFAVERTNGTLIINPLSLANAVIALGPELDYTGSEQTQTFTVSLGGRALTAGTDYTVTGERATSVGEHTLTISGRGNYSGTLSQRYRINGQTITGVIVAQNGALTYNGLPQIAAVRKECSVSGVTFTFAASADGPYTSPLPGCTMAGDHRIYYKVTKEGYETLTGSFIVTIQKATLGIAWGNAKFTYDGEDHVPTATATGVKSGDSIRLTVSGAESEAGTYTARVTGFSGTGSENYELPSSTTKVFEIVKSSNNSNKTTPTPTPTATPNKSTKSNSGSSGGTGGSGGTDKSGSGSKNTTKNSDGNKDQSKELKEIVEGSKLADEEEALKAAIGEERLQELQEAGESPSIRLAIEGLDKVSSRDKKLVEQIIEDNKEAIQRLKVGEYLDITLEVNEEGEWESVSETKKPVRIVIRVPSSIADKADAVYLLKIHDNKGELLKDQDEDPETASVDTGDFSTYVLMYQAKEGAEDDENASEKGVASPTDKEETPAAAPEEAAVADASEGTAADGDGTQAAVTQAILTQTPMESSKAWIGWAIGGIAFFGIVGAVVAVLVLRKKKNTDPAAPEDEETWEDNDGYY